MQHRSAHLTLLSNAVRRSKKNMSVLQKWTSESAEKAEEREPLSRRQLLLPYMYEDNTRDRS